MTTYHVYANGDIVHEDDFGEKADEMPYYDDYAVYNVPDDPADAEYWDIPPELLDYILSHR